MSTIEPIVFRGQDNNFTKNTNDLSSHKFNLFQQFFVVGLDPKLCYNIHKLDIENLQPELLTPKVISKFPNTPLPYLNIPDSFVASHCFPKGILEKVIYYKDGELNEKLKQDEVFVFSLDNLSVQDKKSSLRTNKVYYICLLFREQIKNFKNLSNYRRKKKEEVNNNILIPKVICLSSFSPMFINGENILHLIKNYCCEIYNFEALFDKDNYYPIENIIEEIIYNLPGLPKGNFNIKLDYSSLLAPENIAKLGNKKLIMAFESSPINKSPRAIINYSLLMTFFTVEEIFDIIRSIILEEPILFFCEDITKLTYTIEGVLALIFPLTYPHPVVSVLPEENFSLINAFYHFIFGINYKYSEELWKQKFEYIGDKQKIVIIPIETRFPNFLKEMEKEKNIKSIIITKSSNSQKPLVQLEKLSKYGKKNNNTEQNNKKQIKLPIHYTSKCIKRLEPLINTKMKEEIAKKNRELTQEEKDQICNKEIIDNYLYYFTCILLNYQEYINIKYEKVKSPQKENIDTENFIYKRPDSIESDYMNNELKISEMFNISGFISNSGALDKPFYEHFFKTSIFYNFIKKKLFPMSVMDKLDILFFDDKINEKLSRETKLKKIETKFIEDKSNMISGDINIELMKKEVSDEIKEFFCDEHNCQRGLNYFQYIIKDIENRKRSRAIGSEEEINCDNNIVEEKDLPNFKFYYFVFPKLLNDGIFYLNMKKGIIDDKKYIKYNSSCFYSVFEEEGMKIINNPLMTSNYRNYSYSLNPISSSISSQDKYIKSINKLWLQLIAKSFYCIPNNKKFNYFYKIINFWKVNDNIIDDNTLILLFNAVNKYGDQNMNQEFFLNFINRKRTYTIFLFLKEKLKKCNSFIDYRSCSDKNNPIADKFLFIINSFCTKVEENNNNKLYNICGEQNTIDISSMFNEKDKYIRLECKKESKKTQVKHPIIVSCFYQNGEGSRYQINFRLISPTFILKQNWFKNTDNIDINQMRKEYLEYYLSAIFYFHQQCLSFDFLLPKTNKKGNLFIDSLIKDINMNKKEEKKDNKEEDKKEENKEDKIKEENIETEKKINDKKALFMSTNIGLDLGELDFEFNESPPEIQKKSKSPKKSTIKKKQTKNITCAEFKLNMEETK